MRIRSFTILKCPLSPQNAPTDLHGGDWHVQEQIGEKPGNAVRVPVSALLAQTKDWKVELSWEWRLAPQRRW